MKYTIVLACELVLAGCSTIRDRRDAAWDPRVERGESLLDQIPNEEGGVLRRCGGHLDPEVARREGRSLRC